MINQNKIKYYDRRLQQISLDMDSNSINMQDITAKSSLEFRRQGGKASLKLKKRNDKILSLDPANFKLPGI